MKRRLVVVTQQVDPDDPVLGATVPKLAALAEQVDELVVLALGAKPGVLPDNVRVKVIGAGSRRARGVRFVRALVPELLPRPVAILAHMAPIYAVLAAPWARPLRIPVLLWFTHPQDSPLLRRAVRVSTSVLTADERSFPFASPKVHAIGHGIDVGRFSEVKGYETLAAAIQRVAGIELDIVGPCLSEGDRAYRASLAGPRVTTRDEVPYSEVPGLLHSYDVFLSNTRAGSADKVVYEAGAAGLPVLASSPAFASFLPETLRFEGEDALTARLRGLVAISAEERGALGDDLRRRVERDHSVGTWAERVLAATR